MPHIMLETVSAAAALTLKGNFDLIELGLRMASARVLGFNPEDFVVQLPPPLLAASSNANPLVIRTFASDREEIH
jgi:hypothetical protein